jgi:hypothetical protein
MSVCLIASLLYFLVPPPLVCPSEAEVVSQEAKDKAYEEWQHSLDFSFLEKPYASSQRPQKRRFLFASIKTSWRGSKLKGQVIKLASILSCVPFAMHRSNYSLKRTAGVATAFPVSFAAATA